MENQEITFDWKYSIGMSVGNTRHNAYRDDNKKVQKETHGKSTSFWIDGDPTEYKTEDELKIAFSKKILNISK